ncbi:5138_t:CDS:2 [Rhizophagus irregularis]|nr:5138_t:CDS:2 [Rhizophagus irregularis]
MATIETIASTKYIKTAKNHEVYEYTRNNGFFIEDVMNSVERITPSIIHKTEEIMTPGRNPRQKQK